MHLYVHYVIPNLRINHGDHSCRPRQEDPNTDQTLPVPTAVKAIMAEDIRGQQNPCALTFLAELDEELRNKNKS